MSGINGYTLFISLVLLYIFIKHIMLKKQIRNLARQIEKYSSEDSEKMLDIAFVDRDLEQLAGILNQYSAKQRCAVADALRHESNLKESIANISHDLRTPLTVIIGHLQLLQSSELVDGQRRRVETMLRKAKRMKELIGGFYDLAVLDTEQIVPRKDKLNLSTLLIDFLAENAPLMEYKNIKPEIILPHNSIFIQSDRNMIERVLQNLLTNAVHYSGGEIKICLFTSINGNTVLYMENTVKDAAEFDVERLFERFYTGDKSRNGESTGLGLAVVKLLVEKLGGEVAAEMQSGRLSIQLKF